MNAFDHASQLYIKAAEIALWAGVNSPGYKIDRCMSRPALDEACHLGNTAARDYLEWADNIKKERPELFMPSPTLAPMSVEEVEEMNDMNFKREMQIAHRDAEIAALQKMIESCA